MGTTFTIYLPRTHMQTGESLEGDFRRIPGGHETILPVEDEESDRKYVRLVLEAYGYRVSEAL